MREEFKVPGLPKWSEFQEQCGDMDSEVHIEYISEDKSLVWEIWFHPSEKTINMLMYLDNRLVIYHMTPFSEAAFRDMRVRMDQTYNNIKNNKEE